MEGKAGGEGDGEGGGVVVCTMWSKLLSQRHVGHRCQLPALRDRMFFCFLLFWNRKAGIGTQVLSSSCTRSSSLPAIAHSSCTTFLLYVRVSKTTC